MFPWICAPFPSKCRLGAGPAFRALETSDCGFSRLLLPWAPDCSGKEEVTGGQIFSRQVPLLSVCPRVNLKWTRRATSFG